jgi:hypothetical protein
MIKIWHFELMDVYLSCGFGVLLAGTIVWCIGNDDAKTTEGEVPFFLHDPRISRPESRVPGDSAATVDNDTATDDDDEEISTAKALEQLRDEDKVLARTAKLRTLTGSTEEDVRSAIRQTKAQLQEDLEAIQAEKRGDSGVQADLHGDGDRGPKARRARDLTMANSLEEPILTWVSALDWLLLLLVMFFGLYFYNRQSNGSVVWWLHKTLPREMKALGFGPVEAGGEAPSHGAESDLLVHQVEDRGAGAWTGAEYESQDPAELRSESVEL